jgi:hypothetical protein
MENEQQIQKMASPRIKPVNPWSKTQGLKKAKIFCLYTPNKTKHKNDILIPEQNEIKATDAYLKT